MTKIEEVARAIKAELGKQDFIMGYGDDCINEVVVDGHFDLTLVAIAAVKAMREPSWSMSAAGEPYFECGSCYGYSAMIDAALAEHTP